ncbi:MAG: ABC transporter substrate-binding protein [Eubacteriales bacterium]|nr:ABC transporter substrate-binding protein [Eubacteriales bacterium]
MVKKITGILLSAVLAAGLLAGCGASQTAGTETAAVSEGTSAASGAAADGTASGAEDTADGTSGSGESAEESAAAESTTAASGTEATRLYTDLAGREVEIPERPERIVTINMTAEAIALGLKPVGAAENWMRTLDDSEKEGIESVGEVGGLNYEKILELSPDLIITPENVTDDAAIESLSKIAPTVVGPFFGDAFENLRFVGDLLGRSEEADVWVAAYEEKAAGTKEKLSGVIEEGSTAMVVQISSQKAVYIYPASTWPTVYDVLGLVLPDAEELAEITSGTELSLEKLAEYDPDYIFVTGDADEQYRAEILESSVWQNLSAAKNNRVYTMGNRLSAGDVLALDWALDEVVRAVEAQQQ